MSKQRRQLAIEYLIAYSMYVQLFELRIRRV